MGRFFFWVTAITAGVSLLSGPVARAGEAALPRVQQAAAVDRRETLDEIRRLVATEFAFPEKRAAIDQRLTDSLRQGRFEGLDDRTFASRVNEDLLAASQDQHLYLTYDPGRRTALGASSSSRNPDDVAAFVENRNRRQNSGLIEQRILEGNVRYLNISEFGWTPGFSASAYDAAARFLADADAIIIDLRQNGGGEPQAVSYFLSYFEQPDALLYTLYLGPAVTELRAEQSLPADRLHGKPLLVLVSGTTASAAEAFAYHVSRAELGDVVGEPTLGAANIKDDFPVDPGFVLTLSIGRSVHAVTGSDWERTGVRPDRPATAALALAAAHVAALETLASTPSSLHASALAFDLRTARGRLNPAALTPDQTRRYTGQYGDRTVSARDGVLYWRRAQQPEIALQPLGDDWFAIGPGVHARFLFRDDRATAVILSRPDGDAAPVLRTGS